MTSPELIQYVKNELARGTTRDIISDKLTTQGWNDLDILEVFNFITQENLKTPAHKVEIPVSGESDPSLESNPFHQFLAQNRGMGINDNTNSPITAANPISRINTMTTSATQVKSSHRFLKYFLIIFILILLIAGGALAYASGYFISTSNFFSKIIDSSKNNKTVSFDANVNIDGSKMKISETYASLGVDNTKTANFNMTGTIDMRDSQKLKFDVLYKFKMDKIEAGINIRSINDSIYLNLTKGPNLGFFSLVPFENKWINISMKDKEGKLNTNNPLFSVSPIDSVLINGMTEEQKQHITDITKTASFIKITKKHLPEMMDGSLSYHISFDLDKEGAVSYFKEVTDYLKSIDKNNTALSSLDTADYDKLMKAINNFKGELWLGIFDNLPHKILIDGDIINPEKPEDGSIKVNMSVVYKDWNKPVTIEAPSNAMTIEEFMASIFGNNAFSIMPANETSINTNPTDTKGVLTSSGVTVVKEDSAVDSPLKQIDIDKKNTILGLRVKGELFYDKMMSYKGFCSSKTDGAYTSAITLPKGSIYKCNDTATAWASWIKLSTNDYFCVDSNGAAASSIKLPTGTVCPK